MPENSPNLLESGPEQLTGLPAQVQLLCQPGQIVEQAAFEHMHHPEDGGWPIVDTFVEELVAQRAEQLELDEQTVRDGVFANMVSHATRLQEQNPAWGAEIRRRVMMWYSLLETTVPLEETGFFD